MRHFRRAAPVWVDVHPVVGEGVDAVALRRNVFSIRHRARSQHSSKAPVTLASRMRAAYHAESALAAEAQLQALAKELERIHPGAAGSVREGLAETLTVLRLTVPPVLARTLRSTNSIESMFSSSGETVVTSPLGHRIGRGGGTFGDATGYDRGRATHLSQPACSSVQCGIPFAHRRQAGGVGCSPSARCPWSASPSRTRPSK